MQNPILKYDFHVHTVFSGHSSMDMVIGNIIRKAEEKGLRKIVILEHVPQVDPRIHSKVIDNRYNSAKTIRAQIDAIIDERALWPETTGVEILVGAEIDADPHKMDGTLLLNDLTGIDVILASTHYLPSGLGLWYDGQDWPEEFRKKMYDEWFVWAMHIAANENVNIFAHPGVSLCAVNAIEEFSGTVLDDFEKFFMVCKKFNTAIELNEQATSKLTKKQAKTYINIFEVAKEVGVKFSIGSDAHQLKRLGRYKWVESAIEKFNITMADIYQPVRKR